MESINARYGVDVFGKIILSNCKNSNDILPFTFSSVIIESVAYVVESEPLVNRLDRLEPGSEQEGGTEFHSKLCKRSDHC